MGKSARPSELFWFAVLTAHAAGAVLWWWRQPGGFAPIDPHFWVNRVLPWVVVIPALTARFGPAQYRQRVRPFVFLAFPLIWIAAAIAARFVFPISFRVLWVVPLLGGLLMLVMWIMQNRQMWNRRSSLIAALPAMVIGAALPISQRAATPDTRPLELDVPAVISNSELTDVSRDIRLAEKIQVDPGAASIWQHNGGYSLGVLPMLTFDSRSPDGCWVLFATPGAREGTRRLLAAIQRDAEALNLLYRDDDVSALKVSVTAASGRTDVEAVSRLPAIVWSHLNSYTELAVIGHRKLFVSFGPCGDDRFEVKPMDYPTGRPARFAYLDQADGFHVVEGRSAEKGPFRELGHGPLKRDEPLVMTFFDDARPFFRVTFHDWAAQAGTQPSPTAGWRVPVNAIEFRLSGDGSRSPASIFLTLASTSVGSGYDSVGHSAGVYRNRMTIEQLAE